MDFNGLDQWVDRPKKPGQKMVLWFRVKILKLKIRLYHITPEHIQYLE